MRVQREFQYKGFTVKLGVAELPAIIRADGTADLREAEVALLVWTTGGGASRDVSKEFLKNEDLNVWQENAEAYIDLLLEISRPPNPKPIITDSELRARNRKAVDKLVGEILDNMTVYIRKCDLLLAETSNDTDDDSNDEVKGEPVSAPEQRHRVENLRASLEGWQQAWRASDQRQVVEQPDV